VSVSIYYIEKRREKVKMGTRTKRKEESSQTRQVDVYVQGKIELPRSKSTKALLNRIGKDGFNFTLFGIDDALCREMKKKKYIYI